MSTLHQLIEQYCQNGVEFKPLSELGKRNKGTNITAGKMKRLHKDGAPIKIFAGGKTVANVNPEDISEKNIIVEPSIIVKSRGHIDFSFYDQPFTHKSELWSYTIPTEKANQKFIYYYLLTRVNELQMLARSKSVKLPQLSVSDTDKLLVPTPPREIQDKIVEILDDFTELEMRLELELNFRHKQYDYFRNELFTFDPTSVPHLELGTVATFKYGFTTKAKDSGKYRFLRITDITEGGNLSIENPKYVNDDEVDQRYIVKKGDVLVARTGATYGKTLFIDEDIDAIYASFLIKINIDNNRLLPRFYWHFTKSNSYWNQAKSLMGGGGQPQFNANVLKKVRVPIPGLEKQKEIISILDKFELLVSDNRIGLPAEITARKKQYEYYRSKLLSFQEILS